MRSQSDRATMLVGVPPGQSDVQRSGEGGGPNIVQLSICFGLLAWAGEYGCLLLRRFVFEERVAWYLESMYLAAFVYAAAFVLLGTGLARLVRRRPALRRFAIAVIVGTAALCVLLVLRSLHWLASLFLAGGIGYQLSGLMVSHDRPVDRLVRFSFRPLLAVSALVVTGLILLEPIREWRGYAALPPADPESPNVLFLILDTVTAHDLSLYGYDRPTTPWLESFARDAVTFERAISTSRWTLPSHFSLFTGLYLHDMPDDLPDMRPPSVGSEHPHIAEVLRERGYATAGFVANMSYTIDETGLDRGFTLWDDHSVSPGQIGISTAAGRALLNNARLRRLLDWHEIPIRKHASRVNAAMLDWLDRHRDRPFFVFANYFDAHSPYLPPEEFAARFATRRPEAPLRYHAHTVMLQEETRHSPQEYAAQRDMYDGAIAWLDSELRKLFDALDSRGLLDNTIVVVSSDHGESFGAHGRLGHGVDIYEELVHVPLVISFRGRTPAGGLRVTEPVTLADLPATILDLAGVARHPLPGHTLATAWDASNPRVPDSPLLHAADTGPRLAGLLLDQWHYLRQADGTEELYDLTRDPTEQQDLAADAAAAEQLIVMRKAFDDANAMTPAQRTGPTWVGSAPRQAAPSH